MPFGSEGHDSPGTPDANLAAAEPGSIRGCSTEETRGRRKCGTLEACASDCWLHLPLPEKDDGCRLDVKLGGTPDAPP